MSHEHEIFSRPSSCSKHVLKHQRSPGLFLIFLLLVLFFGWIDQSELADYQSYERIYRDVAIGGQWEIAFAFVNFLFREAGFSYFEFRLFLMVFGSLSLWLLLENLRRVHGVSSYSLAVHNLFLFFILGVFLFEYMVIRLRSGFAIGFISLAAYSLLSRRIPLRHLLSILLLAIAFFIHQSTTAILVVLLAIPTTTAVLVVRKRYRRLLFYLVSVSAAGFLLYMIDSSFQARGEHLFSPLNPVRFFMLSVIPVALFAFTGNESKIGIASSSSVEYFPSHFVRFYIILSIGLLIIYLSGHASESGEAIVRVYTLSSVPALISLKLSGSIKKAPISAYLLGINATFFLATVFLPSSSA